MARIEADREDLYSELTSCVSRWELQVHSYEQPVLLGIRKDNRLSLFIGPDPVYHYDPNNCLRRAYVGGYLYRTQGDTLARLKRTRTETETHLLRYDLTAEELSAFQTEMKAEILNLYQLLIDGKFQILRNSTQGEIELPTTLKRLQICAESTELAPAFPTRK